MASGNEAFKRVTWRCRVGRGLLLVTLSSPKGLRSKSVTKYPNPEEFL
jgi:hypothetical protein